MTVLLDTNQTNDLLSNSPQYAPWIAACALLLVTFCTQFIQYLMFKTNSEHNTKVLSDKKIEERRKEIYKKLNDFYGPFQQNLNKSAEIYTLFFQGKPQNFRTLTYLLDKDQEYVGHGKVELTPNDLVLLSEIIKIGKNLEDLILNKSGLVDDPILRSKNLPFIGTHLLMIRLAFTNEISGDLEKYKNYVFPREIGDIIESNITELKNELTELNSVQKKK